MDSAASASSCAGSGEPQAASLERGSAVGRYIVLTPIGEGGMGVVYRAFDPELDRSIALKVLRRSAREAAASGRIYREAQAMARLAHPNVVTIYDVGRHRGRVFIAMELVEGSTLSGWLAEEPRAPDAILDMFVRAGRGLAAAHVAGLVHRDFKPDNVLVGRDGRVRVTDFGLARGEAEVTSPTPSPTPFPEDSGEGRLGVSALSRPLTRTGAVLGTPAYMAPEQFRGTPAQPSSDQFSFSVALYEALHGQRPFAGRKAAEVALSVTSGERRAAPRPANVAPRVLAAIDRGLQLEPGERWPTMELLLAELQPDPPRARWRVPVAVGTVGALALGAAFLWSAEESPCRGAEARFAAAWSPQRAAAVQHAFVAQDLPMAPAMADRVAAALDAYGDRWVAAQVSACEATRVRGEQSDELLDLRTACLQRRLDGVEAAAIVLEQADADVVANALDVTARLRPLDTCADVRVLRAAVPGPRDPDHRRQVEAVQAHVERSSMLAAAGRFTLALDEAEAAVELAKTADYPAARASALVRYGAALGHLEQLAQARAALLEAWWAAIEAGTDSLAVEAAVGLSMSASSIDERLEWVEHGKAFARRSSAPPIQHAELQLAEASVHDAMADFSAASILYAEVAHALDGIEGAGAVATRALVSLGRAERSIGKLEAALRTFARARELASATFGSHHPIFASIDRSVATTLLTQGETAEALRYVRRARLETQSAYGARSPFTARAEAELATVLHRHGEDAESQQWFARASATLEELVGPSPELVTVYMNWGAALDELGRVEEAVEKNGRALGLLDALDEPNPAQRATALDNLGSALQGVGRYEEALAHHREALPLWAELSTTDIHFGIALRDQARALIGLERHAAARALLEQSVALFEAANLDPMELELSRFHLGRALYADRATRARGVQLVGAARVWFANAGPRARKALADADAWLGAHP